VTVSAKRPPHRPRHRVLTLVVVVLLIAVPAGYLVMSAFQSRDSGEDKEAEAALTNLTWEWPSKVQRRVYEVPVPRGAGYVAYYETNAWSASSLYLQFRTTEEKLERFLKAVGTEPSALREGGPGVSRAQAARVGWDLAAPGRSYAGVRHDQARSAPDLAITVDTSSRQRPRVYVVSTVEF
jgi:hypothetical protein